MTEAEAQKILDSEKAQVSAVPARFSSGDRILMRMLRMRSKDPWVCEMCGNDEIQVACWVYVNTGVINDEFGSPNQADTQWCWICDDESRDGHAFCKTKSTATKEDKVRWLKLSLDHDRDL